MESKLYKKLRYRVNKTIWRIRRYVAPNSKNEFKLIDGSRFLYPLNSGIGQMLYCGNFEEKEIQFLRRTLKQGDIVLDIGANGGVYTLLASKRVGPAGHIYAFEPSQREVKVLQRNIVLNGITNVTIIDKAVGDIDTKVRLAIAKDGALNALVDNKRPDQVIERWDYVPMITIDKFVFEHSLSQIDFIKIDVEGAEQMVFDGAKNFLQSCRNTKILFEASNFNSVNYGYQVNELFAQLMDWGLRLYFLDQDGSLQPITEAKDDFGYKIYNFVALSRNCTE